MSGVRGGGGSSDLSHWFCREGRVLSVLMSRFRLVLVATVALAGAGVGIAMIAVGPPSASASSPVPVSTTYAPTRTYDPGPSAAAGSTDVYHCTLIDPHIASNRYVVSSQLLPDKTYEVHHAIYFLVLPDKIAEAKALDAGGNGWTCFGDPISSASTFGASTWLGVWVPGHGANKAPAGTGFVFPKGSQIIMQVHYNLLKGSAPDRSRVRLATIPATTKAVQPLIIDNFPAPIDLPRPTGVTGSLCDRSASVSEQTTRVGPIGEVAANGLEIACHHDALHPVVTGGRVTTTCSYPIDGNFAIRQVTPHMHLLGQESSIVIQRGSRTIPVVAVRHYNFDEQKSYTLKSPLPVRSGDRLTVSCTYDPRLRQQLPQLRKLAPRWVTWGEGSSDEMCLAIVSVTGQN